MPNGAVDEDVKDLEELIEEAVDQEDEGSASTRQIFLEFFALFFQDTITEETVELLAAYLDMDDYNLETAKKVCGDVAGLASWSMAMSFFYGYALFVINTKVQ